MEKLTDSDIQMLIAAVNNTREVWSPGYIQNDPNPALSAEQHASWTKLLDKLESL